MCRVTLLAIDIGNTNVTLGLFRGAELTGSWRATTRATATPDEAAAMVEGLLALDGHRLDALDAVAIASVVPPLTDSFTAFASGRLAVEPLVIDAAALDGILAVAIDRPAEAGADRLCNALAAGVEFGGPAIIVDLGTSTNFDVVDAGGAYHRRSHRAGPRPLAGGARRAGQQAAAHPAAPSAARPSAPTRSTPCRAGRCWATSGW